ncbi:hypothetical protein [Streptomyces globisporus]|uniref:hypothetical protein n=1 Tax=Streptomyces globisporus TaxID=1908 RepID=UPI0004CC37CE|nr:hypothetical protein [Streptomyces globisporus]
MESPTRRTAAAGAAALLAAGLVAVVGAESESAPVRSDRITTVAQLKESIGVAAELDRQDGAAEIGGNTGGQATLTSRTAC